MYNAGRDKNFDQLIELVELNNNFVKNVLNAR